MFRVGHGSLVPRMSVNDERLGWRDEEEIDDEDEELKPVNEGSALEPD